MVGAKRRPPQPLVPRAAQEGDAPVRVIDLSSGASGALDALGPVVVNEDGTLARISNWHVMTAEEQRTTQRVIAERNNRRLAKLRAELAVGAPLD